MTPARLAKAYNKVLKFSASQGDVDNLISQLAAARHGHWQTGAHLEPGSELRLVTADALRELGRDREADLAQHPTARLYVRNGKLYHHSGAIDYPRSFALSPLEQFRIGYKDGALWSSTDDEGRPLDDNFDWRRDLDDNTDSEMTAVADHFYHSFSHLFGAADPEQAGHDFWLSRNGHGAGFFSHPDYYGDHTDHLQEQAEEAGEYHLEPDYDHESGEPKVTGYGSNRKWGQEPGLQQHNL